MGNKGREAARGFGTRGLGSLDWVKLPMGEYRWSGGPVICAEAADGWMVELSKHSDRGRLSLPLAGPFEGLAEAKDAASSLIYGAKARKVRRVGGSVQVAA